MRKLTVLTVFTVGFMILSVGCQGPTKLPDAPYTANNNPTTLAGRGAPDLEDGFRPAAWVFVDGLSGNYIEVDGHPHVEWIIDKPVSSTPMFQVEVCEPLLGKPANFSCALKSRDAQDQPTGIYYGIAAKEGKFKVSTEYSLLNPGGSFVIRDATGDVIDEIAPLAPGKYLIAAAVENPDVKKVLAITYFTVGEGD